MFIRNPKTKNGLPHLWRPIKPRSPEEVKARSNDKQCAEAASKAKTSDHQTFYEEHLKNTPDVNLAGPIGGAGSINVFGKGRTQ